MIRALYTAATGMKAQELNIDVTTNNLANVNTTAFKKSVASFQDLMYQQLVEPGSPTTANTQNPSGIQVGLGVKPASVQKVFTPGDLASTGNSLDIAIEGDGFFKVTLPATQTSAFTRAGNFQLDQNGNIVTADGYLLDPAVPIPPDAKGITISQTGEVFIKTAGSVELTQAGQLQDSRFPNPAGLKAIGKNLYEATPSSGTEQQGTWGQTGLGTLSQGFLESSNVSVVEQVVNMITAQRAYEASSKGISTADEILSQAINLKR